MDERWTPARGWHDTTDEEQIAAQAETVARLTKGASTHPATETLDRALTDPSSVSNTDFWKAIDATPASVDDYRDAPAWAFDADEDF